MESNRDLSPGEHSQDIDADAEVAAIDSSASELIALRLRASFALSADETHASYLVAADALISALHCDKQPKFLEACQAFRAKWERLNGSLNRSQRVSATENNVLLRLLETPGGSKLGTKTKTALLKLRAEILLECVARNQRVDLRVLRLLRGCLEGKLSLPMDLHEQLDVKLLTKWSADETQFSPRRCEEFRAVLRVRDGTARHDLDAQLAAHLSEATEGRGPDASDRERVVREERSEDDEEVSEDVIAYEGRATLIQIRQIEVGQAKRFRMAGVDKSTSQLPISMLMTLVPKLAARMNDSETGEVAAASLLSFLTSIPIRHLGRLHFGIQGEGIWLDEECRTFCWRPLSEQGEPLLRCDLKFSGCVPIASDFYTIPLPKVLADWMHRARESKSASTCVAELLTLPLEEVRKRATRLLRELVGTAIRPTASKLAQSYSCAAVQINRDPGLSVVISGDLVVGAPSELSYLLVPPRRLATELEKIYQRLGLGAHLACRPSVHQGSPRVAKDDVVRDLIANAFGQLDKALFELRKKDTAGERLRTHFNLAANALLLIWPFLTGTRAARSSASREHLLVRAFDIDLEQCALVVEDKHTNNVQNDRRLVPICRELRSAVLMYIEAVDIAYRRSRNKRCAEAIRARLTGNSPEGILFSLEPNDRLGPLGFSRVDAEFARYGIDPNSGRHWFQHLLRNDKLHGLCGVDVMLLSGRGSYLQHGLSPFSLVDLSTVLVRARRAIDEKLASLGARKVETSSATPPLPVFDGSNPVLVVPPLTPLRGCSIQPHHCAWVQLRNGLHETWRRFPCGDPIVNFGLSLIFEDGVASEAEFNAVVEVLLAQDAPDRRLTHFVDALTDEVGLRRTGLSVATRLFAVQVGNGDPSRLRSGFSEALQRYLSTILPSSRNISVRDILMAQRAWGAQHLPSLLAHFAAGDLFGRTEISGDGRGLQVAEVLHAVRASRPREGFTPIGAEVESDRRAIHQLVNSLEGMRVSAFTAVKHGLARMERLGLQTPLGEMVRRFVSDLFERKLAPSTILCYLSVVEPVLMEHACELDALEDPTDSGLVEALRSRLASVAGSPDGTRQVTSAAIQHLCRTLTLELDFPDSRPAGRPRSYVALATDTAITRVRALDSSQSLTLRETAQFETIVSLFCQMPLRRSELLHLCFDDVLASEDFCVVRPDVRGRLKSFLAHRYIHPPRQFDASQVAKLRDASTSPYLFADEDLGRLVSADRLVTKFVALLRFTQDEPSLRFHSCRHAYATDFVQASLLHGAQREQSDSLSLRNTVVELAAAMGHADERTTINNYVAKLWSARATWLKELNASVLVTNDFVAAAWGCARTTSITWKSRKQLSNADLLGEEFFYQRIGAESKCVAGPVAGAHENTFSTVGIPLGISVEVSIAYLVRCLLGQADEKAAYEANIHPTTKNEHDDRLRMLAEIPGGRTDFGAQFSLTQADGLAKGVTVCLPFLAAANFRPHEFGALIKSVASDGTRFVFVDEALPNLRKLVAGFAKFGLRARLQTSSTEIELELHRDIPSEHVACIKRVALTKLPRTKISLRLCRPTDPTHDHSSSISRTTGQAILAVVIFVLLNLTP